MTESWGRVNADYTGGVSRAILDKMLRDLWPPYRANGYHILRMKRLYNVGFSDVHFRVHSQKATHDLLMSRPLVETWLTKRYGDAWRAGFKSGHNPRARKT